MVKSRFVACTVVAGLAVSGGQPLLAQNFPSKPIRVITSPAGGGNDFVARLLVRSLTESMGQQVIVDNRPTRLIADIVAKAPADGYTLLISGSAHWIGPLKAGIESAPGTPQELTAAMVSETERISKILKAANLGVQ